MPVTSKGKVQIGSEETKEKNMIKVSEKTSDEWYPSMASSIRRKKKGVKTEETSEKKKKSDGWYLIMVFSSLI